MHNGRQMLFLLNDKVFRLGATELLPPLSARRFGQISLDFVRELGCELYAEQPLLQAREPGRASRLAGLIAIKSERVNAALFVAPGYGCGPELVASRFARIHFEDMVWLYERQRAGELTHLVADRQVWRRLAA